MNDALKPAKGRHTRVIYLIGGSVTTGIIWVTTITPFSGPVDTFDVTLSLCHRKEMANCSIELFLLFFF